MNEKNIFDKKFVYFMWSDELKGKEGFYADSIHDLIRYVDNNSDYAYGKVLSHDLQDGCPFAGEDGEYTFFYYDPNYECKLAYAQGKQIQSKSLLYKDAEWVDNDCPDWDNQCEGFRVKPKHKLVFASNGVVSLDTEGVPYILCTGTKEQCLKYALDNLCSNCVNFKTCSPDDFCRGFKKRESEKKWRPFKDIEELKKAWKKKFVDGTNAELVYCLTEPMIWIRRKNNKRTALITSYEYNAKDGLNIRMDSSCWIRFDDLFAEWEFLDGTPCGVEEK